MEVTFEQRPEKVRERDRLCIFWAKGSNLQRPWGGRVVGT